VSRNLEDSGTAARGDRLRDEWRVCFRRFVAVTPNRVAGEGYRCIYVLDCTCGMALLWLLCIGAVHGHSLVAMRIFLAAPCCLPVVLAVLFHRAFVKPDHQRISWSGHLDDRQSAQLYIPVGCGVSPLQSKHPTTDANTFLMIGED
jgi:hypothetical protein